ncbi:MAG: TIGR02300 family protein [Pseudomonadota bacterium]
MPKEEWGVKRLCPTTGKRFYDLNKDPIVSPYTGEVVTIDVSKNRTMVADKADPASKKAKEEDIADDVEVLDDEDDAADVKLDDDLLDDDDDNDDVSLDEIADVAADDDDS